MEINIDDILHFDTNEGVLNIDKRALERNGFRLNITDGYQKELLMMEKSDLLDEIRECMDDTSVHLLFGNGGTVAAYSQEENRMYEPEELVECISFSLRREFDKIVLLKNGMVALYVCENEQVVRKFRDKIRYKERRLIGSEYDEILKQAALELNISTREADELIGCGCDVD